jgi:hypothetical protein
VRDVRLGLSRFVVAISLVLLAASCGGGETEVARPSSCTTVTPGSDGSPTPTPTPCPVDDATGSPSVEPTGELAGEVWEGSAPNIATSTRYSVQASCQDSWELEFTFVVSAEGTIEGQGTAGLTSTPTCNFPIDPVPFINRHEYRLSGEETADGFSIRFGPLLSKEPADGTEVGGLPSIYADGGPVEIAVSGNSGTGEGSWRFQSGLATLTANGTVTVECVGCE